MASPNGGSGRTNRGLNVKISEHFWASEWLPPEAFKLIPIDFNQLITPFLRMVPERFRSLLDKAVYGNNWFDGGNDKYRGVRFADCPVGAAKSFHKKGMAIDIVVPGMSQDELLKWFKTNRYKFPEITTYERISDTPGWNHFDCRFTGLPTLLEVSGA